MRLLLTLLLLAPLVGPISSYSQIPSYLPENGLAAFYPLDSNWQDLSIHGNHANNYGATAVQDRNGDEFGAMHFDGQSWLEIPHSESIGMAHGDPLTWSVWIRFDSLGVPQNIFEKWNDQNITPYNQLMLRANGAFSNQYLHTMAYCGLELTSEGRCNATNPEEFQEGWFHALMRTNGQKSEFYINGILADSRDHCASGCSNTSPLFLGCRNTTNPNKFFGQLDEFAVWSRYLSTEEIAELVVSGDPTYGCTDTTACNYIEEANFDDGSCYPCSIPSAHCGIGTVWDNQSQSCIVANPTDVDSDGCTGVGDVLVILANYGGCLDNDNASPSDTIWTCGDDLEYWFYDYATVQIGDQCWFAENLRSTKYQNGEIIPFPNTWSNNDLPKMSSYGHSSINCYDGYALFNTCDNPSGAYDQFGGLYSYHAVIDSNGICPAGWRAPTAEDWSALSSETQALFPGLMGSALKSTYGWAMSADSTDRNGFDALGFSIQPAGQVSLFFNGTVGNGFSHSGTRASFWTTGPGCRARVLNASSESFVANCSNLNDGLSLRCLKD